MYKKGENLARRTKKQTETLRLIRVFLIFFAVILAIGVGIFAANNNNQPADPEISAAEKAEQVKLKFIDKIAPIAQQYQTQYGIYASIIIAQASLESDFGRSDLASKYNNLFGVKGDDPDNTVVLQTKEYVNDQWITVDGRFQVYDSFADSIQQHSLLFVNGTDWNPQQYKDVFVATDYQSMAKAIQQDGYATDPEYASKVINLIQQYNLTKYD